MSDYGRVFGEEVAAGLGLSQPPVPRGTVEEYSADPAEAFSRMAERLSLGGAIPVPFVNNLRMLENQDRHSRKEKKA